MAFDPDQYLAEKKAQKSAPFDPDAYLAQMKAPKQETPSVLSDIGEGLLSGVQKVGSFVDKYTGAPARTALNVIAENKDEMDPYKQIELLKEAGSKAISQFGKSAEGVPSGKDLAQKFGFSETSLSDVVPSLYSDTGNEYLKFKKGGLLDPTASGAAGLAIDIAADPTNIIPAGAIGKGAGLAIKGVQKAIDLGVAPITKGAGLIAKATEKLAPSIAEMSTGISKSTWKNYLNDAEKVEGLIKKYGEDAATMSDDVRSSIQSAIQTKRQALNNNISEALKNVPQEAKIPTEGVTQKLKDLRDRLDKDLRLEERSQIDKIIERVSSKGDAVTPQEMFDIKNYLQDVASSAYKPTAVFPVGSEAAKAAKAAASEARKAVNIASPSIAEANNGLAKLHLVEDKINKNIIKPGVSDSAFYSAGAGTNIRGEKGIEKLGEAIDQDVLGKIQAATTAKELGGAGFLPKDITGKSVGRMLPGIAAGSAMLGPGIGTFVGTVASSPKAFRQYFKTGKLSADVIRKATGVTGEITDKVLDNAYRMINTPEGSARFANALKAARVISNETEEKQ